MSLGYCTALLDHLGALEGIQYPGSKVTKQGFLQYLLNQTARPNIITKDGYSNGHRRTVNLKYKQRSTEARVSTTEDCDVDMVPAFKETSASISQYNQLNIHIPDDTIRQYCEDASKTVAIGGAPTPMMAEHLDSILSVMNGLYAKMERTLTTSMGTQFGRNARSASAAATGVNIPLTGTSHNLQDGLARILADCEINEICDTPAFVYNGNFQMYDIERRTGALSFNQSGVNGSVVMPYDSYFSRITASTWGDNQLGVFAPGAVHLLEDLRNVGAFAGTKGAVWKGTFADPRVQCWGANGYQNLEFDVMFKYIDCPTTVTAGYAGGATTLNAGWVLTIGKYYDLFVTPSDAYDGSDAIVGQNGTLRYTIQNA
jgi:hypothetical protein